MIRSGNDDNIHKAIKYGVWTTTYKNKNKLEEYWEEYEKKGVDTYLFFSAVKSGHFEGVARLVSGYHEETFPFWWENQHGKFKGHFDIEWLYIKDITYRHFEGLKNLEDEDVTKSRDCDELSQDTTNRMLAIFQNYSKNKSIFSSFQFFDEREQNELRAEMSPEQQQYMYMEQLRQMQMQQMMYSPMYDPQQLISKDGTQNNVANKPFVPNNPGFQMNPVSKDHKKHSTKEKN